MGTWGHQFDQNDGAADFLDEVSQSESWEVVSDCITDFISAGGYEDAQQTVAALEIVAAALGRPPEGMDTEIISWAAGHLQDAEALRDHALEAVDLVANKSELSELWAEDVVDADDALAWRNAVNNLKSRLEG